VGRDCAKRLERSLDSLVRALRFWIENIKSLIAFSGFLLERPSGFWIDELC
jgi:hypothetical protein